MTSALTAGAVAAAASLVATPFVRRLAVLLGATDEPGARRVHQRSIPRAGGLAVTVAAAVGVALADFPGRDLAPSLGAGLGLILGVGLLDDLFTLGPRAKLAAQGAAALLAAAGGLRLELFGPSTAGALALVDAALTVLWIVLITNALNLCDGLDGLAPGIGVIALGWLAYAALQHGNLTTAVPALAVAGALAGFLPYNFNPASIFLGDSGSLVVGYTIAVLPLAGPGRDAPPPLAVFLLVAVPATDTLLAIARRFCSRCLRAWGDGRFWHGIREGLRNTVRPDRRHIHHRLLDLGFTQRRAVLTLYLAAGATGALAHLVTRSPAWPVDLLALGLGLGIIGLVRALGIDELRPARSGLLLPVLRRFARRRSLVLLADLCLIASAYAAALALTSRGGGRAEALVAAIGVVAISQLTAFAVLGVYRTAWEATGVGGLPLLL